MITQEEILKLIHQAKLVRENAFVPITGHKVGSAILTADKVIFGGCNVQSVISELGTCAERSAIDHAVIHGKYEFIALAVVDETHTYPCGACLQYLMQFYQIDEMDIELIISDLDGHFVRHTIKELLPRGYCTKNNLYEIKSYRNKL